MKVRILITAGATREPIDGVRFISNMSTGRTGARLADHFTSNGFEVTFLSGQGSVQPDRECRRGEYGSVVDLDRLLREELAGGPMGAVIHLAAVSDYSVDSLVIEGERFRPSQLFKIKSEAETIELSLKRNPKLVRRLREYASHSDPLIVAFKLTHTDSHAERLDAVARLFKGARVDAVVHNDLGEITESSHPFTLFMSSAQGRRLASIDELARALEDEIRVRNEGVSR